MEQNELCPKYSCDIETLKHSLSFWRCLVPAAFNYFNAGWQMLTASLKVDSKR